jgi:hypothetical protein
LCAMVDLETWGYRREKSIPSSVVCCRIDLELGDAMSRKHILWISFSLLTAFLVVCTLLLPRSEIPRAYAVCRNQMLFVYGCGVWEHQHTRLNISSAIIPRPITGIVFTLFPETGIVFTFSDGSSEAYCSVFRDPSRWRINGGVWASVGTCPNRPAGMYGVRP